MRPSPPLDRKSCSNEQSRTALHHPGPGSGGDGVVLQDIPDGSLGTWRTGGVRDLAVVRRDPRRCRRLGWGSPRLLWRGARPGGGRGGAASWAVSRARLVSTSVVVEGRSAGEVARSYGVSRSWVYELVARYRAERDTAFAPRSRRPKTSPGALAAATVELIVELRKDLGGQGLDAGPETICWHLQHRHGVRVSPSTVARYLARRALVTPQPAKRPQASYTRFAAELPNECWQADFTHSRLADGRDAEILCFVDDHSRYAISLTAHQPVTGPAVVEVFGHAVARHGPPASPLTG